MGIAASRISRLALSGLIVAIVAVATLSPLGAAPAQAGLFDDRAGAASTTAKSKKKNNPLSDLCNQLEDAASQVTDLLDTFGGGDLDLGNLLDTGKILKGLGK